MSVRQRNEAGTHISPQRPLAPNWRLLDLETRHGTCPSTTRQFSGLGGVLHEHTSATTPKVAVASIILDYRGCPIMGP